MRNSSRASSAAVVVYSAIAVVSPVCDAASSIVCWSCVSLTVVLLVVDGGGGRGVGTTYFVFRDSRFVRRKRGTDCFCVLASGLLAALAPVELLAAELVAVDLGEFS